jgi:endonuclease-3
MPPSIQAALREMQKSVSGEAVVASEDPFRVLISTVLSQRTRDLNTEKASAQLFAKYSTPKQIASASPKELQKLVKPAGFYKVKARRIKEISRLIVEQFCGKVPQGMPELLSLPGVGRKTANCVLVYGFKEPAIPVDTHVHRICNRLGLVKTKSPEQTEGALLKAVPMARWIELNHLMVGFGQAVCLPRNPRCMQCGLRGECDFFRAKTQKKQI